MSVNTFFDSIASVSVPVTELNYLKSRLNELQGRVEAQDQQLNDKMSAFKVKMKLIFLSQCNNESL